MLLIEIDRCIFGLVLVEFSDRMCMQKVIIWSKCACAKKKGGGVEGL